MIAEGVYKAKAVEAALGKTKGGKEQVAVRFELLEGGESITWFGYFTDKTFERTVQSLRHCGWQGDDLSDLRGVGDNEVSLVVAHEEYEGKTSARVQWVNAPGGLSLQAPMQEADAKSFAASMRGKILALEQGKGATRVSSPPRRANVPQTSSRGGVLPPEPDYDKVAAAGDDIPF